MNPNHKGAHEYIGEAYLMVGDKGKAREALHEVESEMTRRERERRS